MEHIGYKMVVSEIQYKPVVVEYGRACKPPTTPSKGLAKNGGRVSQCKEL